MPVVEIGSGYAVEPYEEDGVLCGFWVTGPAGEFCHYPFEGRCGGLCRTVLTAKTPSGAGIWRVERVSPLTLSPSIRCACDLERPGAGQHGFVRDGRWVNAGGIVET
jgi:hypothetical protein